MTDRLERLQGESLPVYPELRVTPARALIDESRGIRLSFLKKDYMDARELIAHLTAITQAFDEGLNLDALSGSDRRLVQQKRIGATASLQALAAELERTRSKAHASWFHCACRLFVSEKGWQCARCTPLPLTRP